MHTIQYNLLPLEIKVEISEMNTYSGPIKLVFSLFALIQFDILNFEKMQSHLYFRVHPCKR